MIFASSCSSAEEETVQPEPSLSPGIDLSLTELKGLCADLPESIQHAILQRPEYFTELMIRAAAQPEILTILVDKQHPLPRDFRPADLVSLNDYPLAVNRNDLSLSRSIMPWVMALNEAAKADGVRLLFSSTFRSYEYQEGLYQRYVDRHGKEEADKWSAQAGKSQHQLGTVVDFGSISDAFAETEAGKWMKKNAHHYGFSLSFPKGDRELTGYIWESWHFRYVGPVIIELQRSFFDDSQQRTLLFLHEHKERFTPALEPTEG